MTRSGIYQILNTINEKFYIGSAVNLSSRWSQHKSKLIRNQHPNRYLQSVWNKYGEAVFEFIIIEGVSNKKKLIEREQYWMNATNCYDPNIGYNLTPTAGSMLGRKTSEETKKKISLANIGRKASAETRLKMSAWQIGRKMSDEAKAKRSKFLRDLSTWPHEKGALCKCTECKNRRNVEMRIWQFEKKTSAYIYGQMGMM